MMADVWLTDTPGCLQAFSMRQGARRDIPRLLEHWKGLIARKDEIQDYVPAHWNGDLTEDGFVERYNYVDTLYAGITDAVKNGKPLDDLLAEFDLQTRFPELNGTPGFTQSFVHYGSILALWSDMTGAESASNVLAAAIEAGGREAAVAKLTEARATGSDEYYFLEAEFNALGYRYLGEEEFDDAIAVFEMNAGMYPDSWNVYDSLGEALMRRGQHDLAIRNYNKSIELNPENENGKRMLEEIQASLAKK